MSVIYRRAKLNGGALLGAGSITDCGVAIFVDAESLRQSGPFQIGRDPPQTDDKGESYRTRGNCRTLWDFGCDAKRTTEFYYQYYQHYKQTPIKNERVGLRSKKRLS